MGVTDGVIRVRELHFLSFFAKLVLPRVVALTRVLKHCNATFCPDHQLALSRAPDEGEDWHFQLQSDQFRELTRAER